MRERKSERGREGERNRDRDRYTETEREDPVDSNGGFINWNN